MLALGRKGIAELIAAQRAVLARLMVDVGFKRKLLDLR